MPYPSGAVAFMKRYGLRGNLLNQFGWGEYLIWHMSPSSKVFIDGRYDTVYPLEVIQDFLAFDANLPGAGRVLRSYPHDFVLISPKLMAYRLMRKSAGWKLIYEDPDCALFARTDSAAAKLPGVPVRSAAPLPQYFP